MKNRFNTFRFRTLALGALVASGLVFGSCNKFDNDDLDNGANAPLAGLMAFNLSTDVNALGIALNGNSISNAPLAYTSYTGNYVAVYAGDRQVQTFDAASSTILAQNNFQFDSSRYYSLFLVGTDSNYRNVLVNDNFDSLSGGSGQAYVRYINAIPDSTAPNVSITAGGNNVVNSPAAYASVSGFSSVTPGEVTINVTNGGNISASRTITLAQKKAYTVLLVGNPASTDQAHSVQIRFIENGTLSDDAGRTAAARSAAVK